MSIPMPPIPPIPPIIPPIPPMPSIGIAVLDLGLGFSVIMAAIVIKRLAMDAACVKALCIHSDI